MASAELHIKDSFYFEVPKVLWPSKRQSKGDFPDVWIKNDPQFQAWEAERLVESLRKLDGTAGVSTPREVTSELLHDYEHWLHADHANFGKPLDVYLDEQAQNLHDKYATWKSGSPDRTASFDEWQGQPEQANEKFLWFVRASGNAEWRSAWDAERTAAGDIQSFVESPIEWSADKIQAYNFHLSGKVLIPQPFGQLRNLYQGESGFCISKFMIVEAIVFVVLLVIFSRIGKRAAAGGPPQGRFWNFFETMLVFVRDEIARKAIVSHEHHEDDSHGDHAHGEHAHGEHAHGEHAHGETAHGKHAHEHDEPGAVAVTGGAIALHHAHNPYAEADRFVPLLWTIFFFILGCNLMGMLPWMGAPSSSWGATIALALITFFTGLVSGSKRFGFFGYWANQVPTMGLPFVLAILLVPMIFLIEVLGLVIKHTVLSVRLLANMIAGHLVLLAILMLAFSVEGAASSSWGVTGFFAVVGSAALSILELFVAFLQAYVFTLLSALFINAAIHKH